MYRYMYLFEMVPGCTVPGYTCFKGPPWVLPVVLVVPIWYFVFFNRSGCVWGGNKGSFFLIDTGLVRFFFYYFQQHTAWEEGATRYDQHIQACANISWEVYSNFLVRIFSFFSFSFSFSLIQRPCPQLRKLSIQERAWDE